jgi:hypothetical protein
MRVSLTHTTNCRKCDHFFENGDIKYKVGMGYNTQVVCEKCRDEIYGE